jgi:hypothetical protein
VQFHLVKEGERPVWVAVLAHEKMCTYVANTGKFHDNDALCNDFYLDRDLTGEPTWAAEVSAADRRGIGRSDEVDAVGDRRWSDLSPAGVPRDWHLPANLSTAPTIPTHQAFKVGV